MDSTPGSEDPTSSLLDSLDVQLRVLPNKLRIGQIARGGLPAAAFPLLNLVLFPDPEKSRFLSITHTSEEITVIVDQDDLSSFSPDVMQVGEKTFRALQVSEGSPGATTVGIVQYLSVPLAAAGISIFYLSTYETDFTLIPEENLSQALGVVQKYFAGADIDTSQLGSLPTQKNCVAPESGPQRHPITLPPGDLYLASVQKNQLPTMGSYLMDLLFRTGPTQPFFSYTETDEEVSIILNMATAAIFPPDSINLHTEGWRLLKVESGDKPLGFDETGIVSSIADPLASAKISLFYISTFSTDYPLVPASDISRAAQVLAAARFEIV